MCINSQTRSHTELDNETLSIMLRHLHPWINNFNDVVLFLFQSNMDIKCVGSGLAAKAFVYYITDYITKSNLKIHTGIHTLQAAMKSHLEKFREDGVLMRAFRDRNLVTKCINSLMGRQEVSHQQVMSYLVGGGNYYSSHELRPFPFYVFLKCLQTSELAPQRVDTDIPSQREDNEEDGNVEEWEEDLTVDVSSGEPAISSDIMDYRFRPVEEPFDDVSLWEFIACTQKVTGLDFRSLLLSDHIITTGLKAPIDSR